MGKRCKVISCFRFFKIASEMLNKVSTYSAHTKNVNNTLTAEVMVCSNVDAKALKYSLSLQTILRPLKRKYTSTITFR